MASEEQKSALKFKIQVGIVILIVAGIIGAVSTPGLEKILGKIREDAANPETPNRLYRVGRLMEMTWRDEEALKLYEEMYLRYCGDEWNNENLVRMCNELQFGSDSDRYFVPWVAMEYAPFKEEKPRPFLVVEDAQPHPILARVIERLAAHWEGEKQFERSDHLWQALKYGFPGDPEAQRMAEKAHVRKATRVF